MGSELELGIEHDLHCGQELGADLDLSADPVLEVVDELVFDAVDEGTPDAYAAFVAALSDVALGFGADPVGIARMRAILGDRGDGPPERAPTDRSACAWQSVIRGQAEDFSECGSLTLDEWAADVVARVVGGGRTDAIRRELRRRGVAAFGFLAEAA